jgi:hypothetical protein
MSAVRPTPDMDVARNDVRCGPTTTVCTAKKEAPKSVANGLHPLAITFLKKRLGFMSKSAVRFWRALRLRCLSGEGARWAVSWPTRRMCWLSSGRSVKGSNLQVSPSLGLTGTNPRNAWSYNPWQMSLFPIATHRPEGPLSGGLSRGVMLPALLQHLVPPAEFEKIQAHDLVGWNGAIDSSQIVEFIGAICQKVGKPMAAPADLIEDLKSLPPIAALESTKEVVDGESFTVYSNYQLFGNAQHADVIAMSSGAIDLMGISLMSFHRAADQPLGKTLIKRAAEGIAIRSLVIHPRNVHGLSQILRNADTVLPDIANEIDRSLEAWSALSRSYSNVQCRQLTKAIVRQIATITPEKVVMTPYWFAAPASNERPTLICKFNSVFYKLVRAEFDALWETAIY